jgi:pyruvate kinase
VIDTIRTAAGSADNQVTIMADLPGHKMRIGQLAEEPVLLRVGDPFTLTTKEVIGDQQRASVNFPCLPTVAKSGDIMLTVAHLCNNVSVNAEGI